MVPSRADEYREAARECEFRAGKAVQEADRAEWLRMAEDWRRLADGAAAPPGSSPGHPASRVAKR